MERQFVQRLIAEQGFKASDDVVSALVKFRENYSQSLVRRCPRDSNGRLTTQGLMYVYELDKDIQDSRFMVKRQRRQDEIMDIVNSQPLYQGELEGSSGIKAATVELYRGQEGLLLGKNMQVGETKEVGKKSKE